jgi:hypothetical protein
LTLIPLGVEALFSFLHWATWFPAFLILGLAQTIVVLWLYRLSLYWQGNLLQNREKSILDVVSAKVE